MIVVHGACPTGADAMASGICNDLGFEQEPHPARWKLYGKAAGFIRNQEMVDTHPDLALAYIRDDSPGATDCLNRAAKAGILCWVHREDALGDYLGVEQFKL
jgi:hypothetical protein